MQRKPIPFWWMGSAFGVALVLAAAVLITKGSGEKGVRTALDVTARWSFLLFWMAYAGGAIAALAGPAFAAPARRGREFGVAFASAHLVHIGLIIWLGLLLGRIPLHGGLLVFFLAAIFFTYLLAAMSFGWLSEALGPLLWWGLMFVGLNHILIAFARDFVLGTVHAKTTHQDFWRVTDYAVFAGLCVAAPLLRVAAAARRRWDMRPAAI